MVQTNEIGEETLRDKLCAKIIVDLSTPKRSALVKAGMRSGKSLLVCDVFQRGGFKQLFIIGNRLPHSKSVAQSACEYMNKTPECVVACDPSFIYTDDFVNGKYSNSLVAIDEAMWITNSYSLFEDARKYAPTIAVSSRGPEYDEDDRWKLEAGYSFATWELHPYLIYVADSLDFNDQVVRRDYLAY